MCTLELFTYYTFLIYGTLQKLVYLYAQKEEKTNVLCTVNQKSVVRTYLCLCVSARAYSVFRGNSSCL